MGFLLICIMIQSMNTENVDYGMPLWSGRWDSFLYVSWSSPWTRRMLIMECHYGQEDGIPSYMYHDPVHEHGECWLWNATMVRKMGFLLICIMIQSMNTENVDYGMPLWSGRWDSFLYVSWSSPWTRRMLIMECHYGQEDGIPSYMYHDPVHEHGECWLWNATMVRKMGFLLICIMIQSMNTENVDYGMPLWSGRWDSFLYVSWSSPWTRRMLIMECHYGQEDGIPSYMYHDPVHEHGECWLWNATMVRKMGFLLICIMIQSMNTENVDYGMPLWSGRWDSFLYISWSSPWTRRMLIMECHYGQEDGIPSYIYHDPVHEHGECWLWNATMVRKMGFLLICIMIQSMNTENVDYGMPLWSGRWDSFLYVSWSSPWTRRMLNMECHYGQEDGIPSYMYHDPVHEHGECWLWNATMVRKMGFLLIYIMIQSMNTENVDYGMPLWSGRWDSFLYISWSSPWTRRMLIMECHYGQEDGIPSYMYHDPVHEHGECWLWNATMVRKMGFLLICIMIQSMNTENVDYGMPLWSGRWDSFLYVSWSSPWTRRMLIMECHYGQEDGIPSYMYHDPVHEHGECWLWNATMVRKMGFLLICIMIQSMNTENVDYGMPLWSGRWDSFLYVSWSSPTENVDYGMPLWSGRWDSFLYVSWSSPWTRRMLIMECHYGQEDGIPSYMYHDQVHEHGECWLWNATMVRKMGFLLICIMIQSMNTENVDYGMPLWSGRWDSFLYVSWSSPWTRRMLIMECHYGQEDGIPSYMYHDQVHEHGECWLWNAAMVRKNGSLWSSCLIKICLLTFVY